MELYEALSPPDWTFLVMDYFAGGNLDSYVEKKRGPPEEARHFFHQIVYAQHNEVPKLLWNSVLCCSYISCALRDSDYPISLALIYMTKTLA